MQLQTSAILEAANTAAAAGGDPVAAKVAAAAAAAAQQTLTPEAVQALLPAQDDDDGTSCLLLQLLPQHSEARVRAITARYGPEPARVYKQEGCGFALVVYGDAEARGAFASTFVAAQQLPNAANKDLVLLLPGEGVPGDVVATLNGKRRRDAPARKVSGMDAAGVCRIHNGAVCAKASCRAVVSLATLHFPPYSQLYVHTGYVLVT